jgi:hypothetical protein
MVVLRGTQLNAVTHFHIFLIWQHILLVSSQDNVGDVLK